MQKVELSELLWVFEDEWQKNIKKQFYSELFLLCSGYIRCKTFYDWRKRYERQRIVQKVHSGNKEAVGIIIERYYADIYRFCLYMVQTEDDAYDIAQETFLKFMKYGTSYKHHNLKGYLLTIARNICFNYFRDKKEKVTAIEWEEIDKIPNNKDMLTEAEDAVYLRNLLKELSQDTREVIILRIYEEMKFKDIAKDYGVQCFYYKVKISIRCKSVKKVNGE